MIDEVELLLGGCHQGLNSPYPPFIIHAPNPLTPLLSYGSWRRSGQEATLLKEDQLPKEEWGTNRVCPTNGKRFYELKANPFVSPYTGETLTVDIDKNRTMGADA